MNHLNNKVSVITGGGSGIGKAIAMKFVVAGSYVHVLEKNVVDAADLENEIAGENGKVEIHICDVSIQENVVDVIKKISSENPIDILVNNAGIAHVGNLEGSHSRSHHCPQD